MGLPIRRTSPSNVLTPTAPLAQGLLSLPKIVLPTAHSAREAKKSAFSSAGSSQPCLSTFSQQYGRAHRHRVLPPSPPASRRCNLDLSAIQVSLSRRGCQQTMKSHRRCGNG